MTVIYNVKISTFSSNEKLLPRLFDFAMLIKNPPLPPAFAGAKGAKGDFF